MRLSRLIPAFSKAKIGGLRIRWIYSGVRRGYYWLQYVVQGIISEVSRVQATNRRKERILIEGSIVNTGRYLPLT